ncbi:protein of unknown function [Nitrospira defluvii]|uniref:Uncharacterized protein n=1 Tax=Nitrospira defluvii TaxID=330214 RepID=D8PDF5_9BACT|nr:protein of unknown function [Nitrospira defluvii]
MARVCVLVGTYHPSHSLSILFDKAAGGTMVPRQGPAGRVRRRMRMQGTERSVRLRDATRARAQTRHAVPGLASSNILVAESLTTLIVTTDEVLSRRTLV